MPNNPFNDPREPWITRGILISLASLFDLCKGIRVKFEGDGNYRPPSYSVPGRKAESVARDLDGIQYVADAEFFESCIEEVRDLNVELKDAINLLRDFNSKLSISNLVHQLITHRRRPEVCDAIANAGIGDTIGDFTFDFQELVELSELLQTSFRNRKSHRKLHDGSDRAFVKYHHALMSRFLQLVDKCSEYTQSRGWCTNGPMDSEQGESLPMIQKHIEEFKALTRVVFDEIGPPLHSMPDEPDAIVGSSFAIQQPSTPSEDNAPGPISKTDLYDIVDTIRVAHDESGSYMAWLEERLSSVIASTTEDLKNSLLEPWKDKNIETLLDLIATQVPRSIPPGNLNHSSQYVDDAIGAEQSAQTLRTVGAKSQISPTTQASQAENGSHKILAKLRDLCKEMRNKLNQINPRFEFYHCVLQSPIVTPAIKRGVYSYSQLKQTEEFQSRIVANNRSFMLDEQERMYQERIDQILAENQHNQCPF